MSKAEKIISEIEEADEVEIMEFDFDACFTYMREMERQLRFLIDNDSINDSSIDKEIESLISNT